MTHPSIHRLPRFRAAAVLTALIGCTAHADAAVAPAEGSGSSSGARIFSHICQGCHMPDAQLTDAQVADLVAYFETLR